MKTEHELKCRPEYFARIETGQKTFEIRKNDRDFQVGDILILKEFDPAVGWPDHGAYESIRAEVVYMTAFAQQDGYVVLGIKVIPTVEEHEDEIPF